MRDKDKKLMTTQVFFPFFFREVLDGIAERCAGETGGVLFQENGQREDKKSFHT